MESAGKGAFLLYLTLSRNKDSCRIGWFIFPSASAISRISPVRIHSHRNRFFRSLFTCFLR